MDWLNNLEPHWTWLALGLALADALSDGTRK
jgi:hypothetical protein